MKIKNSGILQAIGIWLLFMVIMPVIGVAIFDYVHCIHAMYR
jgi:hypothetical protein